jgi:acyl-coenzyme A synthetase/AMP-(fatty) acid ligase
LLDEKVWRWLFDVVGKKNALVFDGYGSTEAGGAIAGGLVFANEIGAGLEGGFVPLFGIELCIVDDEVCIVENTKVLSNKFIIIFQCHLKRAIDCLV